MKKIPATLLFWAGCISIILSSVIQLYFPAIPALFLIVNVSLVVFCIRQWYRRVREMNNQIGSERHGRLAAEHYIHERMSPGGQQRKKK